VIGAGKTAMDACVRLLEAGVPADAIRWVRPRDAWLLDRAFQQPLDLVPRLIEGVSLYLEAAAQAEDVPDLFRRLEASGQLVRLDPEVEPTMYRCATVSEAELVRLRGIQDVVRLGRVTHIGLDRIDLAGGSIPTDRGQVHVDCSAPGLRTEPGRPVFADGQITLQQIRACQPVFSAALAGYVEAARGTMRPGTGFARPTRTRTRPWTGSRSRASPSAPRWRGPPTLTCFPGCSDHGSMPPPGSALTSMTR
jgi:hypothetical protein